jgi:hypothetical protein
VLDYSEDELIGMNAWTIFAPQCAQTIMKHLTEKSEEAYRVTAIRKDKARIDAELKGKDFTISGEPVRLVLAKKV